MGDLPTAVQISLAATGLVLLGWMAWGFREYRRTGRATWLWLGVLMAVSMLVVLARFPR
jgi:hypothetical protein